MNKEEFIERKKALRKQMDELKKEYINTNITYPIGTKVRVTHSSCKSRIGVVSGNIIDFDDVVPYVKQITTSGEVSMRRIVVYSGDKIDPINE